MMFELFAFSKKYVSPSKMLFVLLLFAALDLGSSDYKRTLYGESYDIRLPRDSHSITLMDLSGDRKTLWTSGNPSDDNDPRHQLAGSYFRMTKLTQRDSGYYYIWDRNKYKLQTLYLVVDQNEEDYHLTAGDYVDFHFDLEQKNCNVFFTSRHTEERVGIVHRGRPNYHETCRTTRFSRPCRLFIEGVDQSCSGVYAFTDNNGDVASQVIVDVDDPPSIPSYGWVGIAFGVSFTLCYCLKCCCCRKSSRKDGPDSEDAAGDAEDARPTPVQGAPQPASPFVRVTPRQTGGLPYPAAPPPHHPAPAAVPTTPLIHGNPAFKPQSYGEAVTLPEPEGCLHLASSTSDPRFDFAGMSLSAGSGTTDVYTSDKLNFF